MSVWAIVPIKPLGRAKSRLAPVLGTETRVQLAAQLVERTLRLLVAQPGLGGTAVISRDPQVLVLASALGARTIAEDGPPELNAALASATRAVMGWGARACLVVPADIPLLSADDIAGMLALGQRGAIVLAPDRHEQGTNLLLVQLPGLIPYRYGAGSFAGHQRLARERGMAVAIYRSERAALDLDTLEDLRAYHDLSQRLGVAVLEAARASTWAVAPDPPQGYESSA